MDPNLFAIDWEQLSEVLITIVVLAFFVERFLAIFLENKHVKKLIDGKGIKELPAIIMAWVVCYNLDFDALAIIFHHEKNGNLGMLITAGIIAGGSKSSIKLFHDVLKTRPQDDTGNKNGSSNQNNETGQPKG